MSLKRQDQIYLVISLLKSHYWFSIPLTIKSRLFTVAPTPLNSLHSWFLLILQDSEWRSPHKDPAWMHVILACMGSLLALITISDHFVCMLAYSLSVSHSENESSCGWACLPCSPSLKPGTVQRSIMWHKVNGHVTYPPSLSFLIYKATVWDMGGFQSMLTKSEVPPQSALRSHKEKEVHIVMFLVS